MDFRDCFTAAQQHWIVHIESPVDESKISAVLAAMYHRVELRAPQHNDGTPHRKRP